MAVAVDYSDGGCYLPALDCLVFADFHFGYPNEGGHPYTVTQEMRRRACRLVTDATPQLIVVNGDLFHHAPFPSTGTDLVSELAEVAPAEADIIVTPGNHEAKVGGIRPADLPQAATVQDMVVQTLPDGQQVAIHHGHRTPHHPADLHIIGHLHPVDTPTTQRACYLFGDAAYHGADVVILPAFNPALEGTPVSDAPDMDGICPIVADGTSLTDYDIVATMSPRL